MNKTNKGIVIGIAIGIGVGLAMGIIIGTKIIDTPSSNSQLEEQIEELQALRTYQGEQLRSIEDQAEEVSCRSNLRSLATAESMYYGMYNRYGTIAEIVSSGIMENANRLTCPMCERHYSVTILDNGSNYRICCPGDASENHGSIENGIVSW